MTPAPVAVAVPGRRGHRPPASGNGERASRRKFVAVVGALWQPAVLVLLIFMGTSAFGRTDVYPLLVLAGIYGIAVVGVSLLAGLGGQLTLGHAAFMGIGAYASALCTVKWGLSPLIGILLGVAGSLLLALVTSPILRLRGWYLAMATIALALMLERVLENVSSVTGGNNGIYGIPPLSIGGVSLSEEKQYFILSWSIVLVLFVLGRNILSSRYGRAMTAIHKDPDAAASLGINLVRYKATIWLIASVPPAIAGSLFAHYSAFVAPGDFGLTTSLVLFTAVILGGERSIFAALIVIIFLVTLPSYASGIFTTDLIEGIGLVVVYLASPTGAAGLLDAAWRHIRDRSGLRARHS